MDLKNVKEASPIELSEYSVAKKIDYETSFDWWVHYVFKKLDGIISKARTNFWRNAHKYGVSIQNTAVEALELDRQTGHPLWENSLKNRWTRQKSPTSNLKVLRMKKLGEVRFMNSNNFKRSHVTLYLM